MKLGQQITVTHELKRVEVHIKYQKYSKTWEKQETPPKNCILIGIRTLSNGTITSDEDGVFYEPKGFFKAYLVVESLRRKPFFVIIETT